MRSIWVLFSLFVVGSSYKFLVYSPQFGISHVNYLARLSDALVDAGHEVVMISPVMNMYVGGPYTKKARVIEIPQTPEAKYCDDVLTEKIADTAWNHKSVFEMFYGMDKMVEAWTAQCNATFRYPGLIEQLKAENFDVGFAESVDLCWAGLWHLIGLEKYAVTDSFAMNDGAFFYTQMASNPSYVPSLVAGGAGEKMTFIQRTWNLLVSGISTFSRDFFIDTWQKVYQEYDANIPNLLEIVGLNSLVFINSEPLLDFPRPVSARIIDIGGISVSHKHQQLNQTWSALLDERPHTILISFGTFAKAYLMPEAFKETIRQTARSMPDVTFIWKYEKPEHNVSQGIENLIDTTWMPQNDLLRDPRLSAFITHCGQGSTIEANFAGVPLIVIPVAFDQLRNAASVKRNGLGIVMEKTDLNEAGPLEETIREIITNPKYRTEARNVVERLNDKPFTARETFIKNMEFLAKHGPLRQLDHYGKHLNFFQYYMIDVIAFIGFVIVSVIFVILFVLKKCLSCVIRRLSSKAKVE